MAKSYYKVIDGKNYDRDMLNVASKATPRKRGKPLIDLDLAKKLLKALVDGDEYTEIEKKTMKYIRDNYVFAKDADAYIRTEVRRFAATKSRDKKKKELDSNNRIIASDSQEFYDREENDIHDSNADDYASTSYEIDEYSKNQADDSSGFRELVAYKNIDNTQSRERRKKIMIRIVLVALFIIMILGITWSVCKPKFSGESNQGFETIESSSVPDSSNLESDDYTDPITPERQITPEPEVKTSQDTNQNEDSIIKPGYDEYAGELGSAASIRKLSVNKNDPKSSIRYINSLQVTFIKNQDQLTRETQKALTELSEVLKANPNLKVRIEGHTCWIGTKEDNQKLSEARAKLVFDYLVNKGVSGSQLEHRGYGELSSIDTNRSKEGRQRNRRVEFSVLKIL